MDDYLAVVWALLSSVGESRQLTVVSVIAAPFSFRSRFLPVHRATELQEQEAEAELGEAEPLSDAEKSYLKGKQDQLRRIEDAGTTTNRMIERDNHATWCPGRGMEESYEAIIQGSRGALQQGEGRGNLSGRRGALKDKGSQGTG